MRRKLLRALLAVEKARARAIDIGLTMDPADIRELWPAHSFKHGRN
jgi:hypothetical protein